LRRRFDWITGHSADWNILDDLPARRSAEATGLHVIGTLGTLVAAKRAGLLKSIRPELDALVRTSFFPSPQLYDNLLRTAGEIDS
jgi:predicted nucleic acid-binding protein